ncbi:MAG: hypothetical protein MUC43_10525 [Pirellula sp.]|jgi:hypothetical protein|nr:hypothetical protein [Pirellula sp.]
MQIPPAGWSNPAAHTQQGLSNQRSSTPATAESTAQQLNPVEQSQKTGDRDANERYDGPMPHQTGEEQKQTSDDTPHDLSGDCLHLPADDGETSQLDISG